MSDKQKEFIKKYRFNQFIIIFIRLIIVISFLLIWQFLSNSKIINPFIFSSPTKIFSTIKNLYLNNELFIHLFTTIKEIVIAFTIGFIISFILAILLYSFNMFYKVVDPFLNIINSLPKVSLGPILIIWFGANTSSIIIMALLINILVCTESLYVGFIKCKSSELLLFKSLGATKIKILFYLVIPNAFENIITSLKLNISMTLIGVIMGEFLVSKNGIGYLIIYGTQVFNLDLVYAGILILLVLSYLFYKPISSLENKIKKD